MLKKSGLLISILFMSVHAVCLDLNQAQLHDLMRSLPHIGLKKAQAIVHYRHQHHGFFSRYELAAVRGIGERYIERYRELLIRVFCAIP
jgi:competence protein ComEA